jgi:uncharacterized protein RhaS with RHS repeats
MSGRFLSVDPLSAERPGLTPYHYVQNNPINRYDPDGMFDLSEIEEEKRKMIQKSIDAGYKKIYEEKDGESMINDIYATLGATTDK